MDYVGVRYVAVAETMIGPASLLAVARGVRHGRRDVAEVHPLDRGRWLQGSRRDRPVEGRKNL